MVVDAAFPEKLGFLFKPARYKGVYGGRGKGGSWGFARAALILGVQRKLRIVCARETQKSIEDSVHHLLEEQIESLGLSACYEVQKRTILGINGTEFIFVGLRYDINAIKSLEGADILWVEEAHNVSKESWDKVIPTVRKDPANIYGTPAPSEIWLSWNPELDTDETHVRFVVNTPSNAKIVKLSWRDNPWFPPILEIERQQMARTDPAGYRNVWEGETRSSVAGAIYGDEIQAAMDGGRICSVPRDRMRPVDTAWDLGYGDKTAIWFFQYVDGWYRLVDYLEDDGHTIEWYCIQLQNKGYLYGTDWLPHDAVDTIIHQKLAGGDKSRSIEMLMRAAGRKVRVAPKLHVSDRINAGRTIFPQCQIDRDACSDGLHALRRYQWGPVNVNGVTRRDPLHNDASHGCLTGDAMVLTEAGLLPIEKVTPKDRVWTPRGYARVLWSGKVKEASDIIHIKASSGTQLTCTPEHKLFTQRGLIRADALRYSDRIIGGTEWNSRLISLLSRAANIGYRETITGQKVGGNPDCRATFIGPFGKTLAALSLMDSRSIISTATRSTISSQIWRLLAPASINDPTLCSVGPMELYPTLPITAGSGPLNGMDPQRELSGIGFTGNPLGLIGNGLRWLACGVVSRFARLILRAPSSAITVVGLKRAVSSGEKRWVYDLTIENHACYQANGLLVSNSDAFQTFAVCAKQPQLKQEKKPAPPPRLAREVAAWT